jgi:lysophospholipase L1-like esterase
MRAWLISLVVLLSVSLLANALLYRSAVRLYSRSKITRALPVNEERFAAANASLEPRGKRTRVVLFGDSRIHSWSELPELERTQFVNRGISGETTAQMRYRFDTDVLALEPDVVVIQAGVNDLIAASLTETRAREIVQKTGSNLQYFIDQLSSRGIHTVYLEIIPTSEPSLSRRLVWNEAVSDYIDQVNASIRPPGGPGRLTVIDTGKWLLDETGEWIEGLSRDALHLSPEGYLRLNQAVEAALGE